MFDFNEVKEPSTRGKLKFVGYGINEDVVVSTVTSGKAQTGTDFIEVKVKFKDAPDTESTTLKLYFTAKSTKISMEKIMHIHAAVNKMSLLATRKMGSLEEVASTLNTLWVNRPFRLKLTGEEWPGTDNNTGLPKTKVKLNIPFVPFAEPITALAEKPAIKVEDTGLTFDKQNERDYKPLSLEDRRKMVPQIVTPPKPENGGGETPVDDLPF